MITIKDIAKEAGVSHGTVSNVLNKTGKVSTEKIKLVEDVAKRLGYVRNIQAKQLRQGFKKNIALIIPTLDISPYSDIFSILQKEFTNEKYEINLYITNDVPILEKNILEQISFAKVDAIISVSCINDVDTIYDVNCPVIFVDRKPNYSRNNFIFISFDFSKIGEDIAKYIMKNNHKKVAFFSNSLAFKNEKDLFDSLVKSFDNNDIVVDNYQCNFKLSCSTSFNIFESCSTYDAIITSDFKRSQDVLSAFNFSEYNDLPEIISIDTLKTLPSNNILCYQLNYKHLASTIKELLNDNLNLDKDLPNSIILDNDGFKYTFENNTKYKEERTINILTLTSPSSIALKKLLPSFKKATGINVKLSILDMQDLYEYVSLAKDDHFYDLIRMDVAWMSKLAPLVYMPLKETNKDFSSIFSNLIEDTHIKYSYVGNTQYSIPFDPSTLVLLYRKDLFEDALIKRNYYERYSQNLAVPTNFKEFNKVASFFTNSLNPDSPTKFGTTVSFGRAAVAACDFLPRLLSMNYSFLDKDNKIKIDTQEALEALEDYIETYQFSSKQDNSWWSNNINEFNNGLTAMTIVFSNYASNIINSSYSNLIENAGFATIPGNHTLLGGGVIGIAKNSKKVDECYEFFKWFYSSEISSAFTLLGGLSPHKDIYKNHDILSLFPWIKESASYFSVGTRNVSNSELFDQKKFENIVGNSVKNAVLGNFTPKESLEYAQKLIDAHF